MHILVLNCGSSSVKADLVRTEDGERLLSVRVDRVGEDRPQLRFSDAPEAEACPASGVEAVLTHVLPLVAQRAEPLGLDAIGHRVVHGGDAFSEPVPIDETVKDQIRRLCQLAPLHNPINLAGIEACQRQWPDLPQIAVFDTAFHHSLPRRAIEYAIPREVATRHGIRRYGFHGTSHQYVARQAAAFLNRPLRQLRLITCHLGSGASVCAVEYGRSVETSMGMTPLEGLVMGTRSGDLDPGIILHLLLQGGMSPEEVDYMLNKTSGLQGLAGDNDMRDLEERAAQGDESARLAIQVFSHQVRKYIGAYAAV
ncbi:MAG: acetate/propionate family kinase, partial [Bacteroidetes bacterium]